MGSIHAHHGLIMPAATGGGTYAKWSLIGDATALSNGDLTAVRSGGGSVWNTVIADTDLTGPGVY